MQQQQYIMEKLSVTQIIYFKNFKIGRSGAHHQSQRAPGKSASNTRSSSRRRSELQANLLGKIINLFVHISIISSLAQNAEKPPPEHRELTETHPTSVVNAHCADLVGNPHHSFTAELPHPVRKVVMISEDSSLCRIETILCVLFRCRVLDTLVKD
jgi:hypothetical protein